MPQKSKRNLNKKTLKIQGSVIINKQNKKQTTEVKLLRLTTTYHSKRTFQRDELEKICFNNFFIARNPGYCNTF